MQSIEVTVSKQERLVMLKPVQWDNWTDSQKRVYVDVMTKVDRVDTVATIVKYTFHN